MVPQPMDTPHPPMVTLLQLQSLISPTWSGKRLGSWKFAKKYFFILFHNCTKNPLKVNQCFVVLEEARWESSERTCGQEGEAGWGARASCRQRKRTHKQDGSGEVLGLVVGFFSTQTGLSQVWWVYSPSLKTNWSFFPSVSEVRLGCVYPRLLSSNLPIQLHCCK